MGCYKDKLKKELLDKRMLKLEDQISTLIQLLAEHEELLREYTNESLANYVDYDNCTNL